MDKTILLYDRDSELQGIFSHILAGEPIRVVGCNDPGKARALALNLHPDLILLHTEFNHNGYQLCQQLKQNRQTLMIPVLMLADAPNLEQRQRATAAGAIDLIQRISSPFFTRERILCVLNESQRYSLTNRMNEYQYQVLIAEDSPSLQQFYSAVLGELNCHVTLCDNGRSAWQKLKGSQEFDLVITDLFMPVMDGKELCNLIRSHHEYDQTPIIVITTEQEKSVLYDLLSLGVSDFIQKPFREMELRSRVQAHLRNRVLVQEQFHLNQELIELSALLEEKIAERTREIYEANVETIYKLATACDLKDVDTAHHIARVRDYVETFSLHLGIDTRTAREYGYSSMMHDVGKLGIPDAILRKPGPLNDEEWEIMRTHPIQGKELLGQRPFYKHAADIAVAHHERFDGSGYPYGIEGKQIPLSARIVAIVDIYDALTSRRPYKEAWPLEQAFQELTNLSGHHLDPFLVAEFLKLGRSGELERISQRCALAS
ncbi:HD domain-containing phosphohydrolase [Ketobacter sp.]|uniref:HD domain-containing phosphohydrolase n=1 Tax=Ketobacter sp. TaxID=2083498 RepID=UPI0025BC7F36|nr:HD domain-containing phosphohydrolase [Ketobacter sp.]